MLVSALQGSTDLMRQLNQNLGVGHRRCWPTTPTRSANAVSDLNDRRRRCADVRGRQPRNARHDVGQAGLGHPGAGREPRRHQADAARRSQHVSELRQHLPTRPGRADRRAGGQQLRQSDLTSSAARSRPRRGWVPSSRRNCACSTWRRSSRTASTTSCRSAQNLVRRCAGAAQRGHLQRGLDAPGLRSARSPAPPPAPPPAEPQRRSAAADAARRCAAEAPTRADRSRRRAAGMMVPPGGGS